MLSTYLLFLYASGVVMITHGFCSWVAPKARDHTARQSIIYGFTAWILIMLWPITATLALVWGKR